MEEDDDPAELHPQITSGGGRARGGARACGGPLWRRPLLFHHCARDDRKHLVTSDQQGFIAAMAGWMTSGRQSAGRR